MKLLKPETTMYTVSEGIVVKCTILEYFNGEYHVRFPKHRFGFVKREKLFKTIDACIDDFQAFLIREAAKLEMQRPKPGKECAK